jgi:DNA-binding response OmpR family regulator
MVQILVIDDDNNIRPLLRDFLEQDGYEVMEAENGKIGLKLVRENGPDLVITDLIMPEKEGMETIGELRRDFPHVKIIAISGGGSLGPETYLQMAKKMGAHRVFEKPFNLQEMSEAIRELLDGQGLGHETTSNTRSG